MIDEQLRRFSLLSVYEATDYWVDDAPGGSFSFRWGTRCPRLDQLLIDHGLHDWVYVTACNPDPRKLSDDENSDRMRDLEAALRQQPEVKDCVVVGIARSGNAEPCAVAILRENGDIESVVRRANESLAEFQQIRMSVEWPQEDFHGPPGRCAMDSKLAMGLARTDARQHRKSMDGRMQAFMKTLVAAVSAKTFLGARFV